MIEVKLKSGTTIIDSSAIKDIKYEYQSNLFTSIMRSIDVTVFGKLVPFTSNVEMIIEENGTSKSKKNFHIDNESIEYSYENDTTSFTLYDEMIKAHRVYNLTSKDRTVNELLRDIAIECSISITIPSMQTFQTIIPSNLSDSWKVNGVTYRDILDDICKIYMINMYIDDEGMLQIQTFSNFTVNTQFNSSNCSAIKVGNKTVVNSLKYTYTKEIEVEEDEENPYEPQEITLERENSQSVQTYGKCILDYSDNLLIQYNINEYDTTSLFNEINVKSIVFDAFEVDCFGFDLIPYNYVSIKYYDNNLYYGYSANSSIVFNGGMKGLIYCDTNEDSSKNKVNSIYDNKLNEVLKEYSNLKCDILNANEIFTKKLTALEANIGTLVAQQISTASLNADNINTGTLNADRLNLETLQSLIARIGSLDGVHIEITEDGINFINDNEALEVPALTIKGDSVEMNFATETGNEEKGKVSIDKDGLHGIMSYIGAGGQASFGVKYNGISTSKSDDNSLFRYNVDTSGIDASYSYGSGADDWRFKLHEGLLEIVVGGIPNTYYEKKLMFDGNTITYETGTNEDDRVTKTVSVEGHKHTDILKVVQKTTETYGNIASGGAATMQVEVNNETGYTPIGIVGYQLLGASGQTYLNAYRILISGSTAEARVRNTGTTSVTSPYVTFFVLYFKN